MNMPGFTAEASLFNGDVRYQATTAATVYGEFVQPALFRHRFDEVYTGGIFFSCFKTQCEVLDPTFPDRVFCYTVPGVYNPVTNMCE